MSELMCPACRVPARPAAARVDFLGAPRPVRISLRRVPAAECPACGATIYTPAVRAHLRELGAIAAGGLAQPPRVTITRIAEGAAGPLTRP